jgi:hypothetical protein
MSKKNKRVALKDYEVLIDPSPANEIIGDFEIVVTSEKDAPNKLSIRRKENGKEYLHLVAMELKEGLGTEPQYPDMVAKVLKELDFEKPTMFYERHHGKVGLFAIAQKKSDKSFWFYFTVCTNARFGIIEGTNFSIASGLPLLITCKILDSITIRKLV